LVHGGFLEVEEEMTHETRETRKLDAQGAMFPPMPEASARTKNGCKFDVSQMVFRSRICHELCSCPDSLTQVAGSALHIAIASALQLALQFPTIVGTSWA